MKLISLRLPERLEVELEKYSKKLERSKSYLIRKAVEYYLESLSKVPDNVLKIAKNPLHLERKKEEGSKNKNMEKNIPQEFD